MFLTICVTDVWLSPNGGHSAFSLGICRAHWRGSWIACKKTANDKRVGSSMLVPPIIRLVEVQFICFSLIYLPWDPGCMLELEEIHISSTVRELFHFNTGGFIFFALWHM